MWLDIGMILAGFLLLGIGAEGLVRGGAALALRFGLSPLVIGLTIVAFGTSSPELIVSLRAALAGTSEIAIGNVVGSNIVNIGLILGLAALISPMKVDAKIFRMEIPVMVAGSLILAALLLRGGIDRYSGAALVVGIVVFTVASIVLARRESASVNQEFSEGVTKLIKADPATKTGPIARDIVFVIAGLGLLAGGAEIFVRGAVGIAETLGVSKTVIGLTIVAIGTSLPELATSVVAAFRGQSDIAIGNVVGSNVFNVFAILGISATVQPLTAGGVTAVDLGAMVLVSLVLVPMLFSGFRMSRLEGGVLVALYVAYTIFLVATAATPPAG